MAQNEKNTAHIEYDGNEIVGLNILSIRSNPTSDLTAEPIESGVSIADHKVRNPNRVSVSCFVIGSNWVNVKHSLNKMYLDPIYDTKLNVAKIYSKYEVYENMVLVSMPHEENTNEKYDNLYFDLEFKEILIREKSPLSKDAPMEKAAVSSNDQTQDVGNVGVKKK